jgi:hypothetical protein
MVVMITMVAIMIMVSPVAIVVFLMVPMSPVHFASLRGSGHNADDSRFRNAILEQRAAEAALRIAKLLLWSVDDPR